MYKSKKFTIILAVAVLMLWTSVSWSQSEKPKQKHAPNALPGVEPEMLTPEYWASLHNDADEVIMTLEEIRRFNEHVRNKKVERTSHEGTLSNPILPLDLPATTPGNTLRIRLESNVEKLFSPKDMWGSRDIYDGRNAIYNDSMKQDIVDQMNCDDIPAIITRRFGIIVNHASVRQYPTHVPGYHNTTSELDRFQITDLCIGNPVAVLHESIDGDFLYVESPLAQGWIGTEDIALADRETIRSLTDDTRFLMAADHRVPVYGNPSYKHFARYIYLSATMPLIRSDSAGYVVKMPYRMPDGSLGIVNGYIKPDAGVHIGYLPYTKRSILNQMFKLLNTPYGWHGQNNKRDCAGALRVVFRCCGIVTGRRLSSASKQQVKFESKMSTEEKIAAVAQIEPVITTASGPGHVALYLGKAHNGKLYFMHQGGWGYDEGDQHFIVNRVSINEATHRWYHINTPNLFTTIRM